MAETYQYSPKAPLRCPIAAFAGTQDYGVPQADVAAWSEQTTSTFTLDVFAGDHFFLYPFKRELLSLITEKLNNHHTI
jgi:medium-chain acyl-[acyl-carrier-protein] hydrolase